jgi:HEAT repeat protein
MLWAVTVLGLLAWSRHQLQQVSIPHQIAALASSDPRVCELAARSLYHRFLEAGPAIPALERTYRESRFDFDGKNAAGLALQRLVDAAMDSVPLLTEMLHDPDHLVGGGAALALALLGPAAEDTVERLLRAAHDTKWTAEHARFVNALVAIGPGAVPVLVRALASTEPRLRQEALEVLGRLGESARTAVSAIERLVADPDEDVRLAAQAALERIRRSSSRASTD